MRRPGQNGVKNRLPERRWTPVALKTSTRLNLERATIIVRESQLKSSCRGSIGISKLRAHILLKQPEWGFAAASREKRTSRRKKDEPEKSIQIKQLERGAKDKDRKGAPSWLVANTTEICIIIGKEEQQAQG